MAASIAPATPATPRVIPEVSRVPAKATLRKAEIDLRHEIGTCIENARRSIGWTLDQLAAALPAPDGGDRRDARQVRRWEDGTERAQFDVLFNCENDEFVGALYELLAPLSRRYERVTAIRRLA